MLPLASPVLVGCERILPYVNNVGGILPMLPMSARAASLCSQYWSRAGCWQSVYTDDSGQGPVCQELYFLYIKRGSVQALNSLTVLYMTIYEKQAITEVSIEVQSVNYSLVTGDVLVSLFHFFFFFSVFLSRLQVQQKFHTQDSSC